MPYAGKARREDDVPPKGRKYGLTRFGAIVRYARLNAASPQSVMAFAEVLGTTKDTISRAERGMVPETPVFLRICELLHMSPASELLEPPLPGEDVSRYLNRDDAMSRLVGVLREHFTRICATDKTFPYLMDETNALGERAADGAVWMTPRQIAQAALREIAEVCGTAKSQDGDADGRES